MKPEEMLTQIQEIENEGEKIIQEARKRAQNIIEEANRKALKLINTTKRDLEEERKLAIERT
ncbi:MAG: hypothetical protein ACP5RW_01260, partial [bacterium]